MIQSETKEKTIESHPLYESWNMGEGYYYSITITTKYEDDVEETERTEWFIHPNGTFSGNTHSHPLDEPPVLIFFGGTFEESKYNDYVEQMKKFKGDWEEELEYDDELYKEYPPHKSSIFLFNVQKFEEVYMKESSSEKTEEGD
jgi:hypothetical protein